MIGEVRHLIAGHRLHLADDITTEPLDAAIHLLRTAFRHRLQITPLESSPSFRMRP